MSTSDRCELVGQAALFYPKETVENRTPSLTARRNAAGSSGQQPWLRRVSSGSESAEKGTPRRGRKERSERHSVSRCRGSVGRITIPQGLLDRPGPHSWKLRLAVGAPTSGYKARLQVLPRNLRNDAHSYCRWHLQCPLRRPPPAATLPSRAASHCPHGINQRLRPATDAGPPTRATQR